MTSRGGPLEEEDNYESNVNERRNRVGGDEVYVYYEDSIE